MFFDVRRLSHHRLVHAEDDNHRQALLLMRCCELDMRLAHLVMAVVMAVDIMSARMNLLP